MFGDAMPALICVSSLVITAPPETSEPVPAVVGISTSGSTGGGYARPPAAHNA